MWRRPDGRLTDRFGIIPAIGIGILFLLLGYLGAGCASALWQFTAAQLLIGVGASSTFAPLMAEASRWFIRRRGIAVGIAGSGYYLSGALWPWIIDQLIGDFRWQIVLIAIGIFSVMAMTALVLILQSGIAGATEPATSAKTRPKVDLSLTPNALTTILSIASFCCCVAMAIPQVHIVAYSGDLGYGVARGTEMLSLMLAFGAISRVASGFIADRLGGLPTLLIGSVAQASALAMYLVFDGLASLYVISALFGLFHGGIVSSYAIIVRETMPVKDAAVRVGTIIMVSLFGMSFGGWIAGEIFDMAVSYRAAFLNGIGWNALNIGIILLLLRRPPRSGAVNSTLPA